MSATHRATKRCPRCQAPLDAAAYAEGRPFTCSGCGAKVQRRPKVGERPVDLGAMPVGEGSDGGFLDELQELLIKMILGIFQFILLRLPQAIYRALVRWFPTVVKVAKILVLAAVWLLLAAGPLFLIMNIQGPLLAWRSFELPLPDFYVRHADAWNYAVIGYTLLALYASIWGALYVRRRRKQAREDRASANSSI